MAPDTITVAGIEMPSVSPLFLAVVGFHVVVGAVAVIAGIAAMLSKKQPGRHPRFGTVYFWCLSAVFASRRYFRSCAGPRTIICSFSARSPLAPHVWAVQLADNAGEGGPNGTSPLWGCRISCS